MRRQVRHFATTLPNIGRPHIHFAKMMNVFRQRKPQKNPELSRVSIVLS
jgi:hypothetical protein